jgi:hypothetical protein
MEIRLKPLIKGVLSFAVPSLRSTDHPSVLGSGDSRYCYSAFLRHFSHVATATGGAVPKVIVELGPGNSIGTGLAGVIAGAERCIGLDLQNHMQAELNVRIFDELVELFRARTPVPREIDIATAPVDWGFPKALEPELDAALDDRRIAAIRRDIEALSGTHVAVVAPWSDRAVLEPASVDWLFSHSVMEHIDDVAAVYASAAAWLKPGGLMSHEIDYGSHRLTRHWNGHWTIDDTLWRLIRGARPYLINRLSHRDQLEAMRAHGLELIHDVLTQRADGLAADRFNGVYASMSEADARTHIGFVLCRNGSSADRAA